jgi:hypothetical protein
VAAAVRARSSEGSPAGVAITFFVDWAAMIGG